jgi:hypothetical protein
VGATPSNYIHNHLGNFAASADAICRDLVMGGVAWARNHYCDLISHWEKRNRTALENYNTARTRAIRAIRSLPKSGTMTVGFAEHDYIALLENISKSSQLSRSR